MEQDFKRIIAKANNMNPEDEEVVDSTKGLMESGVFGLVAYFQDIGTKEKEIEATLDALAQDKQIKAFLKEGFLMFSIYKLTDKYFGLNVKDKKICLKGLGQVLRTRKLNDMLECLKRIGQLTNPKWVEQDIHDLMKELEADQNYLQLKALWEQIIDEGKINGQTEKKDSDIKEDIRIKIMEERIKQMNDDKRQMPDGLPELALMNARIKLSERKLQTLKSGNIQNQEWKADVNEICKDLQNKLKETQRETAELQKILRQLKESPKLDEAILNISKVKEQLISLDIHQLVRLILKTESAKKLIRGKQIALVIGTSGAGKTTIITKMLNYNLVQKKIDGMNTLVPSTPLVGQHAQLVASPEAKSITRYIFAVKMPKQSFDEGKQLQIYICDSPGFGDLAGVEVDIANGVGMINAIHGCKSVRPIVLLSEKSWGDRGQGPRSIGKIITELFYNYEQVEEKINIIFNKFEPKRFQQLPSRCKDLYKQMFQNPDPNEAEPQNPNLQSFIGYLVRITGKLEQKDRVDPLSLNVKQITKKLIRNTKPITNPKQHFKYSFTDATQKTIKNTCSSLEYLIKGSLGNGKFEHANYYLKLMKLLGGYIQTCDATSKYNSLVQLVENKAKESVGVVEMSLVKLQSCKYAPEEKQMAEIKTKQENLKNFRKFEFLVSQVDTFCQMIEVKLNSTMDKLLQNVQKQKQGDFAQTIKLATTFAKLFFPQQETKIKSKLANRLKTSKNNTIKSFQDQEYTQIDEHIAQWIKTSKVTFVEGVSEQKNTVQQIKRLMIEAYKKYYLQVQGLLQFQDNDFTKLDKAQARRLNSIIENSIKMENIPHFGRLAAEQNWDITKRTIIKRLTDFIQAITKLISQIVNDDDKPLNDQITKIIRTCKDNLLNLKKEVKYVEDEKSGIITISLDSLKNFIKKQQNCVVELVAALKSNDQLKIQTSLSNIKVVMSRVKKLSQFGESQNPTEIIDSLNQSLTDALLNYLNKIGKQRSQMIKIEDTIYRLNQLKMFEGVMDISQTLKTKIMEQNKIQMNALLRPLTQTQEDFNKLQLKKQQKEEYIQNLRTFMKRIDRFLSHINNLNDQRHILDHEIIQQKQNIQILIFKELANNLGKYSQAIVSQITSIKVKQNENQKNNEQSLNFINEVKYIQKMLNLIKQANNHTKMRQYLDMFGNLKIEIELIDDAVVQLKKSILQQYRTAQQGNLGIKSMLNLEDLCRTLKQLDSDLQGLTQINNEAKKFSEIYNQINEYKKGIQNKTGNNALECILSDSIMYDQLRNEFQKLSQDPTTEGKNKVEQVLIKLTKSQTLIIRDIQAQILNMKFQNHFGQSQIKFIELLKKANQMYSQLTQILVKYPNKVILRTKILQEATKSLYKAFFSEFETIKSLIDQMQFKQAQGRIKIYVQAEKVMTEHNDSEFQKTHQQKLSLVMERKINFKKEKIEEKNQKYLNLSTKLSAYMEAFRNSIRIQYLNVDSKQFNIDEKLQAIYEKIQELEKKKLQNKINGIFQYKFQRYQQLYGQNIEEADKMGQIIKNEVTLLPHAIRGKIQEKYKTIKQQIRQKQSQVKLKFENRLRSGDYLIDDLVNEIIRAFKSQNETMRTKLIDYFDKHFQMQIRKPFPDPNQSFGVVDQYFFKFCLASRISFETYPFLKERYIKNQGNMILKIKDYVQAQIKQLKRNISNQFKISVDNSGIGNKQIFNFKPFIQKIFEVYNHFCCNSQKIVGDAHLQIFRSVEGFCTQILRQYNTKVALFKPEILVSQVQVNKEFQRIIGPCNCLHVVFKQLQDKISQSTEKQKQMEQIHSLFKQHLFQFERKSDIFKNGIKKLQNNVRTFELYNDMIKSQGNEYYQQHISNHEKYLKILQNMERPYRRYFANSDDEAYDLKDDYANIANTLIRNLIERQAQKVKNVFTDVSQPVSEQINTIMRFYKTINSKAREYIKINSGNKLEYQIREGYNQLNINLGRSIQSIKQAEEKQFKILDQKIDREYKNKTQQIKDKYEEDLENYTKGVKDKKKQLIDNAKTADEKQGYQTQLKSDIEVKKKELQKARNIKLEQQKANVDKKLVQVNQKRQKYLQQICNNLIIFKKTTLAIAQRRQENLIKVTNYLKKFQKQCGRRKVTALYQCLDKNPHKNLAQMIISDEPIFNFQLARIFKEAAKNCGIDHVIQYLDRLGTTIDSTLKQNLKTRYEEYQTKFKEITDAYVQNAKNPSYQDTIVNQIQILGKQIQISYKQKKPHDSKPQLVALIFALWTILKAQVTEDGVQFVYEPHPAQIVTIFLLLGLGKQRPSEQIIKNRMAQVGTGQGKSFILAGLSAYLAVTGFKVCCACYSQYLSGRDHQAFSNLFSKLDILKKINYGTFNKHCENLLNPSNDRLFKDTVKEIILKPSKGLYQKFIEVVKQVQEGIIEGVKGLKKKIFGGGVFRTKGQGSDEEKTILIIDEVDVFFNKSLFGSLYTPSISLQCPNIKALLQYVWKQIKKDPLLTPEKVYSSKEYNEVKKIYQPIQSIIKNQVHGMICSAKNFQHDYLVIDQKVAYRDQDSISYTMTYGLKTVFANCYEYDRKSITSEAYTKSLKINLAVSEFSYAMLPTYFEAILGVTGTLDVMPKFKQQSLVKRYQVEQQYLIPSVYGNQKRRKVEYKIVNSNQFEDEIIRQIRQIKGINRRPMLVYFKTARDIANFFMSERFRDFRNQATILNEQLDFSTRDPRIRTATEQNKITLITQAFGRGTDYIIYDPTIVDMGGVHLIHTYVTMDQSEEIQVKGRIARQGKPGSYKAIFKAQDLQPLGIQYQANMNIQEELARSRGIKQQQTCNEINPRLKRADQLHQRCVIQYDQKNLTQEKLIKYIEELNKYPEIKIKNVKIVIAVDATGSMSPALSKVLNIIDDTFKRTQKVLDTKKVQGNFELQIVVYRNYNVDAQKILQYSPFENKPQNITAFLKKIEVQGGMGDEAIQLAFNHINKLSQPQKGNIKVDQVIIIADAAANTRNEVTQRRQSHKGGQAYWTQKGIPKTFADDELKEFKRKGIPVHSFHLGAENYFNQISNFTEGTSKKFNIGHKDAAEMLTEFVVGKILISLGGSKGEDLIKAYQDIYHRAMH